MENGGTEQKRDGHLTVYVLWPVTGGVAIAALVAIGVGGLALIGSRGQWLAAAVAMGSTFFGLLILVPAGTYLYALLGWGGPSRLEKIRQEPVIEEVIQPQPQKEWIVRNPYPLLLPEQIASEIRSIEPDVDPEIREMYDFICKVWPTGNASREHVCGLGIPRRLWHKYVGGARRPTGAESDRGLLDRAGCVRRTSAGWELCATLEEALGVHKELRRYADERAQLVRLR